MTQHATHPAGRSSWPWQIYVVVMTIAVGLLMAWLSNKLMVEEVIKRATTRIYAPLLSLNYPSTGQRSIAVLTLDDTDLKEYGLSWPVPLDYYQRLLDGVVKKKPKAIFLDVLFLDDKPKREVESLIGAACRATDAGIPFFLATFALDALTSHTEQQIFAARTASGVPCVIPVRPNVTPDTLDQSQWAYPLRPRHADEENSTTLPDSVALSIYCRLYPSTCPVKTEVPLALIWATKAAPTNAATMVVRDKQGQLSPVCRDLWNWWEVIPGAVLFRQIANLSMLPLCPYNQVIPVRAFKNYGFTAAQLDQELNGKVVLIGADLKAIGDNLFSPLHGRLPGVHVHAMALDNLISFEGKYRENGDFEWHELWHSSANLFIFLSLLMTAGVMVPWNIHKKQLLADDSRNSEPPGAPKRPWLSKARMICLSPFMLVMGTPGLGKRGQPLSQWLLLPILHVTIYFILGFSVLLMGYYGFLQGPLSIIEYVMFPVMAHFLHLGDTFAQRSRQIWEALNKPDPWAHWALLGAEDKHGH